MGLFRKVFDRNKGVLYLIHRLFEIISIIMIFLMTFVTFGQVVMRYVFNNPLIWPEELDRYLFIWMTFLGTAVLARQDLHINVTFFIKYFPKKIYSILYIIVYSTVVIFCVLIIIGAVPMIRDLWKLKSPALGVPRPIILISMPFCILITALDYVAFIVDKIKELRSL